MTAVYITAIIAAALVTSSIITAARDVAKTKHQTCPHCGRDKNQEQQ